MLLAVAAPFVGLGEKEKFIFYRLADLTRTDVFRAGALVTLVALVGFVTYLRRDIVRRVSGRKALRPAARVFARVRLYYSLPSARSKIPFHRGDQVFLLIAAFIFQAVYLFIIPLVFECDAGMYFNYAKSLIGSGGAFTYYRPPGFPAFLVLTGQLAFDSFIGTVIAHAAMGILAPLLVYRSLAPMHRLAAFICAAVFILSTVPFFGAKLMLAEHLFTFLIVGMIYGFSRYYFGRDPRFIYLAVFLGFAAIFTRWEAQIPLLFAVIALVLIGRKETRHLRHLVLGLSIIAVMMASYSYLRSQTLNEPALFGSLYNGTGRQLFWIFYSNRVHRAERWEVELGLREARDDVQPIGRGSSPAVVMERSARLRMVVPENGPANQRLQHLILKATTERPEAYRSLEPLLDQAYQQPGQPKRDYYQEFYGQFDGNPEALVENIFNEPNGFYTDYIVGQLQHELGIGPMGELLQSVAIEAFVNNPIMLVEFGYQVLSVFGVDLGKFIRLLRQDGDLSRNFPALAFWGEAHYAKTVYNVGECAENSLPPTMLTEILLDHEISFPLRESIVFTVGNTMRNLVRNTVGLTALLTWWFLPLSPHRWFMIFIAASALSLIGVSGGLGGGAYTRYELAFQPLILMVTAGALLAMCDLIRKLLWKIGHTSKA